MFCGVSGPTEQQRFTRRTFQTPGLSLTMEDRVTVHVLRCVFQQSMSHIVILHEIIRNGLETSPAEGDDQWIFALENLLVPSMFLQTHLHVSRMRFSDRHAAENGDVSCVELIDKFAWDLCQFASNVHAGTVTFVENAHVIGHVFEFGSIELKVT